MGEIKDYPTAVNGLQVENAGTVTKVAVAVDACEAVLKMAVAEGADLLIVHHGAFLGRSGPGDWRGLSEAEAGSRPQSGGLQRAIFRWRRMPKLGNNALLCDALDLPGA